MYKDKILQKIPVSSLYIIYILIIMKMDVCIYIIYKFA